MRLLRADPSGGFSLKWFARNQIPRYAILSHRWEADDQEVTLQDVTNHSGGSKQGYRKLQFCGEQAKRDGIQYFWVDSCCINKMDFTEVSTAINSMFQWYRKSAKCYVYLSDVCIDTPSQSEAPWESAFRQSGWFTRGWTLQELLAPESVEFFSQDGRRLGDKASLERQICEATGIAIRALQGTPLSQFGVNERMSWAARRETTIEEDQVYCLMAIFGIFLPVIYGEGVEHAFLRLLDEIRRRSSLSGSQQGTSTLTKLQRLG
jgi:hypothetical protein